MQNSSSKDGTQQRFSSNVAVGVAHSPTVHEQASGEYTSLETLPWGRACLPWAGDTSLGEGMPSLGQRRLPGGRHTALGEDTPPWGQTHLLGGGHTPSIYSVVF